MKRSRQLYDRARRKAFVAAGLRTDGKPRVGRKPCGCLYGSCLKCATAENALILKPALVAAMWADYEAGMTLSAVGRKYGRGRKGLAEIFKRRGYKLRPAPVPRLGYGVKIPEPTAEELAALIAKLPRLSVPPEIKVHWRKWPLAQRAEFIQMMRKKFPSNRPTKPFSSNVIPFDYGTPEVHAIAKEMNRGRTSQTKIIALKPCSEGVIYRGRIYFWDKHDVYVQGTKWTPENGRPVLTHVVWKDATGQPVPARTMVIQKDGNKNNFAPENLALISMAENGMRNSIPARLKKDPRNPVLLAKNKKRINQSVSTRMKNRADRARTQTLALIRNLSNPSARGLMAAITERSK
jgi:hypothetical protein